MAKITKIQAQKRKGRYNIFLDNKYAFAVSENILLNFHLYKDTELTAKQIEEIKDKENIDKYYVRALDYISHQIRTKKEINDFLRDKEADSEIIVEIIKKLEDDNYLNDELYTKSFINTQLITSLDGPMVIQNKLFKKGINKQLANDKILEVKYEDWLINAKKAAVKIEKRSQRQAFKSAVVKIKTGLMQKGYTTEIIEEVISKLDLEIDDEQEQENLQREFEKAKKHYSGKDNYKNKIYQALMRKGFNSADISSKLNEI
ncbi:regulatory protein RecX [Companilactobacillus sp. RD055328]|uniref:recombination regulator RecX n=1 Tax=Companilactobacillus sp. RD055328 TaxID=2916634 RepID=UPI001FC7F143|nr:recombination regulator RecX [Companilactobacillus sp. RD055328]GKQ43108.1 regulatory protein RecX [Companilactobacillus sp. RD055328]